MDPGRTPRRLAQPHGAYINCQLTPRLRMRRQYTPDTQAVNSRTPEDANGADALRKRRWDGCWKFDSNDELFDVREGEVLISSKTESGSMPNHRRGVVFSSLNKWNGGGNPPEEAVAKSDLKFVGLAQTPYVASNTSLQSQGLVAQCSGVKTVINMSEETINVGDRLMAAPMLTYPSKQRKGIPNEKVTMCLKKVKHNYVPSKVKDAVVDEFVREVKIATTDETARKAVEDIITATILAFRKSGEWVVGKAVSSARNGEQMDVLLTKPSFL